MNLTTGIVLVGDNGPTSPYMLRLTSENQSHVFVFKNQGYQHYSLFPINLPEKLTQQGNEWYETDDNGSRYTLSASEIRLFFPQFSADTYSPKSVYILNLYTYIGGKAVELGCYRFRRGDSLACPPVKFGGMDEYYEYIDFTIVDPFKLHFANEGLAIRDALGEPHEMNDTSSLLYACLNIVEEGEGCYIKKTGWTSGQNSVLISDPQDLKLSLNYNNNTQCIHLDLSWNEAYTSFYEYLRDTYHCANTSFIWEYVIMDKDDIYYKQSKLVQYVGNGDFDYSFSLDFSVDTYEGPISDYDDVPVVVDGTMFSSWDEWKEGLVIQGSVSLINITAIADEGGDVWNSTPYITVFSNKLPLSQDLYSRMIEREGYESFPKTVQLDDIEDMINYDVTAINKIEQKVTVVTPTDTAKNHIVQPVFYQTRDLSAVIIHPSVTENISLNLDSYKSRVTSFKVQIEGVAFPEIGRTNKGIVFKIYGNMLPKAVSEGTIYVLDQDNLLVTSGKFNYIY